MNLLKLSYFILFTLLFAVRLFGDSPVDRSGPLRLVSDDFGLADGPSWQGWYLTVPDPKAQVVKRFIIKQNKWNVLAKEKRFSASFFNHGKSYFADHGEGAIRCLDQNNKWSLVYQEDLAEDKRRKPNDLVVDRSGGVYIFQERLFSMLETPCTKCQPSMFFPWRQNQIWLGKVCTTTRINKRGSIFQLNFLYFF